MALLHRGSRVLTVLLALSFVVSLSAYGSRTASGSTLRRASDAGAQRAVPGTLRWWNNYGDTWVKSLDPAVITDSVSIGNVSLINANLVKTSYPSLKPIPDLATWKVSKNHKFYTFHIRRNARFSNGDPVTAQDAAWSITRSLLPSSKSPVASTYLGEIVGADAVAKGKSKRVSGVTVLNRYTLQIRVKDPIAYFLGTLSYPTADVLDRRVMQGKQASTYLTNTCSGNVGAGPFKLVCRNRGSGKSSFYPSGHTPYLQYRPNPYYYGQKARIKIIGTFYAKVDDVYRAYEAGGLDGTVVPTASLQRAQRLPGFSKKPALITDYITPNQQMPPFNNENCRLAVAYAIDRENITRKLLRGTEGPLYDVLPPGLPGYFGRVAGVPTYDPAKAKQYLDKCPGKLNNVTMTYQNTSTDVTHEYNAVRANLAAIGANITLKPLTFNAWLNVVAQNMNQTKNQEQITENLWLDDYPDSQDWLQNLLQTGANYDIGGYSNKTFDSLVNRGNTTFNPVKRAQLYRQANMMAVKTGAWIGVGYQYDIYVINPRVKGMINTASQAQPLNNNWANVTVR